MLRAVYFCLAFFVALAITQAAGVEDGLLESTGPLPPPPPNAAPFIAKAPAAEFKRIGDQKGSSRTAFTGTGPGGVRVELRDVTIAPQASIEIAPIKGLVVIDARSGEGRAKTGDISATFDTTNVASIVANGKIEVQNQSESALVMMVYIVEGR